MNENVKNKPVKQTTNDVAIMTANHAAACAAKLAEVQVISAYPITPQSPVVEKLMEYVDSGEMKAEFVTVESEHSAITVCIAASAVGARVFTASCANGLALMHEMLHWAAGTRLPIVMAIPNRAVAAPWNILNDQQDSISQRDTGWMQIYCRNNQEVMDTVIQAFKIAEEVYIPIMVCYDGYVLSHTLMPVDVPDAEKVKSFLPEYVPHTVLDPQNPQNINPVTLADPRINAEGTLCHGYYEIRYLLQEAHTRAIDVTKKVGSEFGKLFGREYGIIDTYRCDNAKLIALSMGSVASEAMDAVDMLRDEGYEIGVMHLRLYRPFPAAEIAEAIRSIGCKGLAVMEKNTSYGYEGVLCSDTKAALFDHNVEVFAHSYVMGLGGRDVKVQDIIEALKKSYEYLDKPRHEQFKTQEWINCKI
ncbi:MAG: pyruvate ferredoxin oxidoreductase [Spirochaetae bacterium HGW-Spirochaetae-1]|jgi:pyruvate/2-oxoacid:ferredoxin oxidoreductase alpha subunit|nr:MAG: pyruvate ferredoxin oxidoreductase [Spirochaetae bacterium HGW-Spirochaetae-1]